MASRMKMKILTICRFQKRWKGRIATGEVTFFSIMIGEVGW